MSPAFLVPATEWGAAKASGRSLVGYLLVPRPKDLVKALIVPLTFAVGVAAQGGVSTTVLWHAALVWVLLELLVYQARYQWNDVRGFAADQAHPGAAARGRLPGPIERAAQHITASLAVAAVRLAVTAWVAVAVADVRGIVLAMTVGVFAVAVVYEHLRSVGTGRTSEVPVPLHPSLLALWVAVGTGYAVRGMTGLALAVQLGGRPVLVVACVVTMWALGVVFVTCRWALEAMCFASFHDGRVLWDGQSSEARDHTLGLVRWLPSHVGTDSASAARGPAHWRALQAHTPLTAPWHLAFLVAGGASAIAGGLLAGRLDVPAGFLLGALGVVAAVTVTRLERGRGAAAPALAGAVALLQAASGLDRPVVAALPMLVVLAAYACFTHQCAAEVGRPLRRLEPLLRR
jgi:hypothetical protein